MAIVGIDLGTTYSLVGVFRDGAPRLLENALGSRLTPSVVGLDDHGGRVLVGQAAKERLITHPGLTAATFKRFMGTDRLTRLGTRDFRPEELSSFVLRSLKADAEAILGEPVEEAVISVPAYFGDAQRKATRAAGELAGLKVERLINEPTAAALAYGLHEAPNETSFLVFDLGGGTFDVSIVELFNGVVEVHASAGDSFLGGEDFTSALATAFLERAGLVESALAPGEKSRLWKQAELAKRQLTEEQEAEIRVTLKEREVTWSASRAQLEQLTTELVERMRRPVERAMRDAQLRASDLDAVVLVGGATRMPLVRALAARLLGRFPLTSVHPDEAVALGTALQAGLKSRDAALSEVVLTDTSPHSLGVAVAVPDEWGQPVGLEFSPIIERNTVVPVSREQSYTPIHDQQREVHVEIYQGESRRVENNVRLGSLTVPLPPGKARERQLLVRFSYDINGLLEVDTKVAGTEVRRSLVIEGNPGQISPEEHPEAAGAAPGAQDPPARADGEPDAPRPGRADLRGVAGRAADARLWPAGPVRRRAGPAGSARDREGAAGPRPRAGRARSGALVVGPWAVLGIGPTTDVRRIKEAYAARLKRAHPEDDAQAFQQLREAYEAALALARWEELQGASGPCPGATRGTVGATADRAAGALACRTRFARARADNGRRRGARSGGGEARRRPGAPRGGERLEGAARERGAVERRRAPLVRGALSPSGWCGGSSCSLPWPGGSSSGNSTGPSRRSPWTRRCRPARPSSSSSG